MARDFRFGFSMRSASSAEFVRTEAQRAESLGFDVLLVPDHLGIAAPFPALATVAAATSTLRIGTFVLNACFYKPALLARDVETLRDVSGGRFEVGLGAGYVREEFDAAELPFPSARQRIEYLDHVTGYLAEHLPDVPIVIAGNGDRLLTVAGRHADVVGLTGSADASGGAADPLAERIDFLRGVAGERFESLELNLAITAVPAVGTLVPDFSMTRRFAPDASDEELLASPGVLSGTAADMAAKLRRLRENYGITYIVVQSAHADAFAHVIAELR